MGAVGGGSRNQLGIYLGPKELSALHLVNPKLDGIVDWGWFGIIAKPLFMVLHFLNDAFVHNYGWSIMLITLIINVAMSLALIPAAVWVSRKFGDRMDRSPAVQRLMRELGGYNITAASDSLATLAEFEQEAGN